MDREDVEPDCRVLDRLAGLHELLRDEAGGAHRKMNPDLAHYRGTTQPSKAGPVWTGKVALSERALLEPLRRRKPTTWFVNSMGDLFHEDAPDE